MAKNKTTGDEMRKGAIKSRSHIKNQITGTWTKRDPTAGGKFMDVKADAKPFKGVRKTKSAEVLAASSKRLPKTMRNLADK